MKALKKPLAIFLSLVMAWSQFGFVLPAYADEIESTLYPQAQAETLFIGSSDDGAYADGIVVDYSVDEDGNVTVSGSVDNVGSVAATSGPDASAGPQPEETVDEELASQAPQSDASGNDEPTAAPAVQETQAPKTPNAKASATPTEPQKREDSVIHIATFDQLKAVGSGAVLADGSGAKATFALDAAYYLDNDIAFPVGETWAVPMGFTGSFAGPATADATRIYDEASDTVYIQNVYQLYILASEGRDEMPVMTGDVAAETFGSGQLIYTSGSDGYVTYDSSHNYVLSAAFTAEEGSLDMLSVRSTAKLGATRDVPGNPNAGLIDGRDYFGQVTFTASDGETYILIGDRQQLDAINNATSASAAYVCKPVYKVVQTREVDHYTLGIPVYKDWDDPSTITSVSVEYPGDADLVAGVSSGESTVDFSYNKLYDLANVGHVFSTQNYDYHDLDEDGSLSATRTVYCTIDDSTGQYNLSKKSNTDLHAGTYTKDGNYIVFRDIDMTKGDASEVEYGTLSNGDWKPLMFTGYMYGVKAVNSTDVGTIGSAMQTMLGGGSVDTATRRPTISNFNVVPITRTQLGDLRLDLGEQTGVGFFGTIIGEFNQSALITDPALVQNIRICDGAVTNNCVQGNVDTTLVSGLLSGLGWVLGGAVDVLLKALTNKDFTLQDMLTSLLNAREKDPTSMATGAFAGRIMSDTVVKDCEAADVTVTTVATHFETGEGLEGGSQKLVGVGGFVGHVEGETEYEGLSNLLGALVSILSSVLNIIPGLGLGDLINVLLENGLALGDLIPVGYASPTLDNCVADNVTLENDTQKIGVGGFAGSVVGTRVTNCVMRNSTTMIKADTFAGGFAGVGRDAVIEGTLSGLNVDVLQQLHPQSEFINCRIENSQLEIEGKQFLGGFTGCLANSYVIDATVDADSSLDVTGSGDYVAGFCGKAQLGTLFEMGSYLATDADLLATLTGTITSLVGSGSDQMLLDIGGVSPSAIAGVQVLAPVTVECGGSYAGGLVGRGDGTYIVSSNHLTELPKYSGAAAATPPQVQGFANYVADLRSVHADGKYAGGLAGYLTSASIGGLLGETVGLGQFLGFTVRDTTISGNDTEGGYTVSADGNCAAGGIGWAVGGDVEDTELLELASVSANNHAGGFVGATGPGDLASGEGLDLQLLGIDLLSIDNLLSLVSGVRTTYTRANVTGIEDGFTVCETGFREGGDETDYVAGGWAAEANSVRVVDCHAANLLSVTANMEDAAAGGFVGDSSAGGLAGVVEEDTSLNVAQVDNLINAVPYLVPSYDGCSVTYVDGGFVQAEDAGGFAGRFQSGKVNTYVADDENPITDATYSDEHTGGYACGTDSVPWSVYNIHHVRGGTYAGGWGGNVYSGALASAGGGLSVLGKLSNISLDVQSLLGLASVYVPTIVNAGVNSTNPGFQVYAAHDYETGSDGEATAGYAGGFIGYGSGVQVTGSDVNRLRTGDVLEPDALTSEDNAAYARLGLAPDVLESQDGSNYMRFADFDTDPALVPYAVAGAHFAGGYVGYLDVGNAASLGGGLKLLGNSLSLTNVLDALSVVVSTIEHSDVYGAPGGFSVVSSSHINLHDGTYDDKGVGYAGGYAGKIAGGHIQDGNVENFAYIIGENAAGGYVGEMVPGDVADVLDEGSINLLGTHLESLASLLEDFVPTIRNSQTTCIPCGGAVRAEKPSDNLASEGSVLRGMAGGYVGHCKGGQIWGMSADSWKDELHYSGEQRECAAYRIRSVYGAEYAGGFCGLMECASTAQAGGLSLFGGLINASNLLSALDLVYPTVKHAAVYGPLYGIDEATWNMWKQYVGAYGGFAAELVNASYADLQSFEYGIHVVAGRHEYDNYVTTELSGCAGGFVGAMHGGVIQDESHAEDVKLVLAMRAAGGFAGEMQTKGLAEFGSVDLFGTALDLNLENLLKVADVLVPAISTSGVTGYQKGLTVGTTGAISYVSGTSEEAARQAGEGCTGGFVGGCYGGQIGINDDAAPVAGEITNGVWVRNLKEVRGTKDIGGFAGRTSAASVLDADTENASNSFIQRLLNRVINTPENLGNVLEATVSTIKFAEVTAFDESWGFVVDGRYNDGGTTRYSDSAGGFAGSLEASVLGQRKHGEDTLKVEGLRAVLGGFYAGGFFGLADVGSVAEVGGTDSEGGSTTTILSLIQTGNISLLDAFRTYIYHASVSGVSDGIRVYATAAHTTGTMSTYSLSGCAGGFGGGLINGTVENSSVQDLNYITAPNYSGGFIGYAGKNGSVSADEVGVTNDSLLGKLLYYLGLDLDTDVELFDIVGATITSCTTRGFADGFITETTSSQTLASTGLNEEYLSGSCSAGFIGYADATQIEDGHVYELKEVLGPQIAAGFIGRTSVAYIGDVDLSADLLNVLLNILSPLLVLLRAVASIDLIDLDSASANMGFKVLSDGSVLYINLFGFKLGISLEQDDEDLGGEDAVIIVLGSSTIKLPFNALNYDPATGRYSLGETSNVTIQLIEGNRTSVKKSDVTGIGDLDGDGYDDGYDVFGGGAEQARDGSGSFGYAGGFVGMNDNGYLGHDAMVLCDVVRGAAGLVGPFAGHSKTHTRSQSYLEGNDNSYRIYRSYDSAYTQAMTSGGDLLGTAEAIGLGDTVAGAAAGEVWNRYAAAHKTSDNESNTFDEQAYLEGATQNGSSSVPLEAYISAAKAKLMDDTPLEPNGTSNTIEPDDLKDPCEESFDLTVNKKWEGDLYNLLGTRPESITVYVWQADAGETPPAELIVAGAPPAGSAGSDGHTYELTLTAETNAQTHTDTWKARFNDLPIAFHPLDGEGNPTDAIHYYRYYVSEVQVTDYTTTYAVVQETASVNITNTYTGGLLPYLGAYSAQARQLITYLISIPLLCFIVYRLRKGRQKGGTPMRN